jgi:hypothetical protein
MSLVQQDVVKLPEPCHTCNQTCLKECKHYYAREAYFEHPRTRKMIYDIQMEDFTLHAEGEC